MSRLRPVVAVAACALFALSCRERGAANSASGGRGQASGSRAPEVDSVLSHAAAQELASVFRRAGTIASVTDATVRTPRHVIVVRVAVGQVNEEADRAIAAIEVRLDVDAQRNDVFRVASVGIDANRQEAILHAIREWSVAYAIPIVDALRTTEPDVPGSAPVDSPDAGSLHRAPPMPFGPYLAFPGPTGVRGEAPASWRRGTPEMHQALFARFESALDELIPVPRRGGFHTMKITLHVRNGAAGEGECLVDGAPNVRLCDLARTYAWPTGPYEFLFKQYYVFAPRGGPGR